jgi:hypothetical protein
LENLATDPGFGSGLEDSDPLTDRVPRPKDPDPVSVRFGFVPSTNLNPNESFAYIEKDWHESDSNPNLKSKKKNRHLLIVQRPLKRADKIMFVANSCIKIQKTRQRKRHAKSCQILDNFEQFWVFLPVNKDSNPWLWDSNLLALSQNCQKYLNL